MSNDLKKPHTNPAAPKIQLSEEKLKQMAEMSDAFKQRQKLITPMDPDHAKQINYMLEHGSFDAYPDTEKALNDSQMLELLHGIMDAQDQMIEDAERDRQTAETRFIESQKFEKKSFKINVVNMIFAFIAAAGTLFPIIVMIIKLLLAQH